MRHRTQVSIAVFAALALVGLYWGCDRLSGDAEVNQLPEVRFINVPLDADTFSYAPVVHWTGYDRDGFVVSYQYVDDSSQAAIDAYDDPNPSLMQAYIAGIPDSVWNRNTTYQASDTIYLRRGENDSVTEHVFMVRCIDNLNGISPVKVKILFRTNKAPKPPRVKWALDATLLDSLTDYTDHYVVPDTLFWGDTTTITYPGIGFLWQASDPDEGPLNIIELEFSWLLVCDREDGTVDTMPHPLYNDSNQVAGFASGWSPWSLSTQVTFAGWFADSAWCMANLGQEFELDGRYRFMVRVRDDARTEADSMATASFTAIETLFDRQLLIVNWTRSVTTSPSDQGASVGGRPSAQIDSFYNVVIPEAFNLAEQWRTVLYPGQITEPLSYNSVQVDTFGDRDLNTLNRTPYDLIRHYKWIWVIHDNSSYPIISPPPDQIYERLKVFMDYMNAGGQTMLSGRFLFWGCFTFTTEGAVNPGPRNIADNFLQNHFGLSTISPAILGGDPAAQGDFAGAKTTNIYLPHLQVDTSVVRKLRWRLRRFTYLPEIDYFGRSVGRSGYDYATTMYNYESSTAFAEYNATNVDCDVDPPYTPSRAILKPIPENKPILAVQRVFNRTRNVYGEVIRWYQQSADQWRILVSTPADSGAWITADTLEVDYTYVPIEESHDEPVATNFNRIEGVVTVNNTTGSYTFEGRIRFRSAFFAFPLSLIKNDVPEPAYFVPGEYTPVAKVLANQILFFNSPYFIDYSRGQSGALR